MTKTMATDQKIVPHLWYNNTAEQAAQCYSQLLPDSAIGHIGRYSEAGQAQHQQPAGAVMSLEVSVAGYQLVLINGGPMFRPTPALSFFLHFDQEAALAQAWTALSAGGTVRMPLDRYPWSPLYGWVDDVHGVSWQLLLQEAPASPLTPSLLFTGAVAGQAEAAIEHYSSLFPDSAMHAAMRHDGSGPDAAGTLLQASFQLAGQSFRAADSAHNHQFGFSEATSLLVLCDSQAEIDHYWQALSAVPEAEACGWLKDRFGVSWQIVPRVLIEGLKDPDPATVQRVTEAFMSMKKLDMATLQRASKG